MTALQLLHAAHIAEVTAAFLKFCSCVSGRQHSTQLHDMGSYQADLLQADIPSTLL